MVGGEWPDSTPPAPAGERLAPAPAVTLGKAMGRTLVLVLRGYAVHPVAPFGRLSW